MTSFSLDFRLAGTNELIANLNRLEQAARARVGRRMVVRGSAVLRTHMRRHVRQLTVLKTSARKNFARAIVTKGLRRRGSSSAVMIGPEHKVQADGHNWGLLANIFEPGAAPHKITASPRRILSDGSTVFGAIVNHPGIRTNEPLRRGFEAGTPEALRVALRVGWEEIAKSVGAV